MLRPRMIAVSVSLLLIPMLAGCGGGSGHTPTPPAPTADLVQRFLIDFEAETVTPIQEPRDGSALVDVAPGGATPEMETRLRVVHSESGNFGRRHVNAQVINHSSGKIGVNRQGAVTGVDLVFESYRLKNSSGTVVKGGGVAGAHAWNPVTQMPIFRIPKPVAVGKTSPVVQIDFVLPRTATRAVVGIIVRADTERNNPVHLGKWYLSTVAGQPGTEGYHDGPVAAARFRAVRGLVCREAMGDVLLADYLNLRICRLHDGQASTFSDVGGGAPVGPWGIAEDAVGNIVVSTGADDRIMLVPANGGTPSVIAGTGSPGSANGAGNVAQLNTPRGLATQGNHIYAADHSNKMVRRVSYDGSGSRFVSTNYQVSTVYTGINELNDVAVDGFGNLYIAQYDPPRLLWKPADGSSTYIIAGTGAKGSDDGRGNVATFQEIESIALDDAGAIYVAEKNQHIRRVAYVGGPRTSAHSYSVATLVPNDSSAADGPNGTGKCTNPEAVTVAADGTIWFSDYSSLRRLDLRAN